METDFGWEGVKAGMWCVIPISFLTCMRAIPESRLEQRIILGTGFAGLTVAKDKMRISPRSHIRTNHFVNSTFKCLELMWVFIIIFYIYSRTP
jgi:hypothetical protein